MKRQLEAGAVISYLNIALNMAISIFLTPFLLSALGDVEYGVYKTIQSFVGPLTIVSFGIAPLIVRNIVLYDQKEQKKEKENFLFFAKGATFASGLLMVLIGAVMALLIPFIYDNFTPEHISLSQRLILLMACNLALTVLSDSYLGIVTAHERFVMSNLLKTAKLTLRVGLIVLLVAQGMGAMGIAVADCAVSGTVFLLALFYDRFVLLERSRFHRFDRVLLSQCLTFSLALLLQSVVSQINQNMDNVILGFMTTPETVSMYSIALSLFTIFNTLVTAIGGLFGPRAARLVATDATGEELTDFVVGPGRYQLIIAGLAIGGFTLFGRDFLTLWVGERYLDAYAVTLLLLIPSVIPLVESVTISILDAMLKRLGRSLILCGMCVINVVISVLLIPRMGYIGAAIGTAASVIVGHGILANIYLKRVADLRIGRMFFGIFRGILPAFLAALVLAAPLTLLPLSLGWFLLKCAAFTAVYALLVFAFGMNRGERAKIKSLLPAWAKQ